MTNQNTATRDTAAAKHSENSSNYNLQPVNEREKYMCIYITARGNIKNREGNQHFNNESEFQGNIFSYFKPNRTKETSQRLNQLVKCK